ncbi:MAG: hypothetical protein AAF850_07435 [Pseudomonadota bacterium]
MMNKDLRREQITLLKFEKKLEELAQSFAAARPTVARTDSALAAPVASDGYEQVRLGIISLSNALSEAHTAIKTRADELGVRTADAFGLPKRDPYGAIRSILGSS